MSGGKNAAASALGDIESQVAGSQQRMNAQMSKSGTIIEQYQQKLDRLNKTTFETNKLNREIERGGFAKSSNADIAKMRQMAGEIDRINASSRQAGAGMGMFGQAFKGAFIGAIAGMAFSTLIEIPKKLFEVGVSAVESAAKFEMTRNAMQLFTGSARLANQELETLAGLARQTPGLRLDDAQVGATRLRALGFEAKTAQNIVVGLAKQKLISGVVDEGAISRVIINLQQLSAGSPQIQRDIQQMVLQIPSLSLEIQKAFGGIEKFKAALRKDPDAALEKFTQQLADAKAPVGGLLNAWGKLEDAFIQSGRTFGEPILGPASDSMVKLTEYLYDNTETWTKWGQAAADSIQGVSDAIRALSSYEDPTGISVLDTLIGTTAASLGLNDTWNELVEYGRLKREKEAKQKRDAFTSDPNNLQAAQNAYNPQTGEYTYNLKTDAEIAAIKDTAKLKADQKADRERRQELEQLKMHSDEVLSVIKNRYATEEATIDRTTAEIGAITTRRLAEEYLATITYWDKVISLEEAGGIEYQKAQIERNKALGQLETELRVNELETQRKVQKEKLVAQKEFNDLQLRQIDQNADKQIASTERAIDRQETSAIDGYAKLAQIEQDAFTKRRGLIEANYQIEIQNKTLTNEQLKNLEIEKNLDVEQLTIDHNQRLLELQDKQRQKFIENLQFQREQMSDYYQYVSSLIGSFEDNFFNTQTFSSSTLKRFEQDVLKSGDRDRISNQIKIGEDQYNKIRTQSMALPTNDKLEVLDQDALQKLSEASLKAFNNLGELRGELQKLDDSLPGVYFKFKELADQIGTENIYAFDELRKKILESRQTFDKADVASEVDYYTMLVTTETDLGKKQEYNFKLSQARRRLERIEYDQSAEGAALYAKSLKGLDDAFNALEQRDPKKLGAIRDAFLHSKKEDRNALAESIELLQLEINSNDTVNQQLQIQAAHLQDILDIRSQEVDAVIRINRAQTQIDQQTVYSKNRADADLMEFFAKQKGVTELLSDARINLITKAYDGLDMVIGKLTKRFGAFGDVVKELLTGLIKLALNKVFQRLFGVGGGQSQTGGGGASGIFGNIFGGGGQGVGGTPNFNPNYFGGGSGTAIGGGNITPLSQGGTFSSMINTNLPPQSSLQGMSNLQLGGGGRGFNLSSGIGLGASAAMMIGGAMGGIAGSAIQFGGMGAMLGLQFGGPVGAAIGAGIGFVGGGLLGFFMKAAKRRKEERLREKAMGDAFRQMDKLIEDVNADRIDGASALSSAEQIRASYLESMGQLTDKKTKNHALKDVSRIDAKIEQLKAAVAGQTSRQQRLELFAPTFADGGTVSKFARDNYRNNPLGYQTGGESLGYFPASGTVARFNERGSEYIFDAETTRNVGTQRLDLIRHTKGQALNSMLSRPNIVNRAGGGALSFAPMATTTAVAGGGVAPVVNVIVNIDGSTLAQAIAESLAIVIRSNDGSSQQMEAMAKGLENNGTNKFAQNLAEAVKASLGI